MHKLTDFKIRMISVGTGVTDDYPDGGCVILYALLEDGRIFAKSGYSNATDLWDEIDPAIGETHTPME